MCEGAPCWGAALVSSSSRRPYSPPSQSRITCCLKTKHAHPSAVGFLAGGTRSGGPERQRERQTRARERPSPAPPPPLHVASKRPPFKPPPCLSVSLRTRKTEHQSADHKAPCAITHALYLSPDHPPPRFQEKTTSREVVEGSSSSLNPPLRKPKDRKTAAQAARAGGSTRPADARGPTRAGGPDLWQAEAESAGRFSLSLPS